MSLPLLPLSFLLHHTLLTFIFFFFNDTATTEIYTLSLHDALPISTDNNTVGMGDAGIKSAIQGSNVPNPDEAVPSFEWQKIGERFSRNAETDLVCRLLLEKKKNHPCTAPHQCAQSDVSRTATAWHV